MDKNVITIGYEVPDFSDIFYAYSTNQSLLDADIVVFEPDFSDYSLDYSSEPQYKGKPCYDKNSSFRLQEDSKHWQTELSTALEAGKTVFVSFYKFEDFFIHTGNTQSSGTGKTARISNIVTLYNNYQFFPIQLPPIVPKEGKQIIFSGHPVFSSFWNEFKDYCKYESYLDGKVNCPLFTTKTGGKSVGALFKVGTGNLILFPPIIYDEEKFTKHDSRKKKDIWTPEAVKFGNRLIQIFLEIDKTLRKGEDRTPPPDWTREDNFQLVAETQLTLEIEKKSKEIDSLIHQKNEMITKLDHEVELKNLLFEKGINLENGIILGLNILGYKAQNYNDGKLEIDQVIVSPEGDRFIGEAEGKDNTAVNIDKFRQLVTNIQEDLQKEEVKSPANGILFGNGFRLTMPAERTEQFTEKCINTAKSYNYALMRTSDLFQVSKYVTASKDESFAKSCREAIKNGAGKIVVFPTVPNSLITSK
jgi:hypothetical protein